MNTLHLSDSDIVLLMREVPFAIANSFHSYAYHGDAKRVVHHVIKKLSLDNLVLVLYKCDFLSVVKDTRH